MDLSRRSWRQSELAYLHRQELLGLSVKLETSTRHELKLANGMNAPSKRSTLPDNATSSSPSACSW